MIPLKWIREDQLPQRCERLAHQHLCDTFDKMMDDRKHLTAAEVQKLLDATKGSRNAARDRCLLLLMFKHGLRVSEACELGAGPGEHGKPCTACRAAESWPVHHTPAQG